MYVQARVCACARARAPTLTWMYFGRCTLQESLGSGSAYMDTLRRAEVFVQKCFDVVMVKIKFVLERHKNWYQKIKFASEAKTLDRDDDHVQSFKKFQHNYESTMFMHIMLLKMHCRLQNQLQLSVGFKIVILLDRVNTRILLCLKKFSIHFMKQFTKES